MNIEQPKINAREECLNLAVQIITKLAPLGISAKEAASISLEMAKDFERYVLGDTA